MWSCADSEPRALDGGMLSTFGGLIHLKLSTTLWGKVKPGAYHPFVTRNGRPETCRSTVADW